MPFETMLTPQRIAAMRKGGYWPDRLIWDYFDDAVRSAPDRVAVVDGNSMTGRSTTLSYRQLHRRVRRMAAGLAGLGVQQGDVVAYQLPNWWEFTALTLACHAVGAVVNPLMPIFRERELRFMLGFAGAKLMVVPREFRGFDYPAMLRGLRPELPDLREVLVVDGGADGTFEQALLNERLEDQPGVDDLIRARRIDPNDVMEIQYTSGTTGEPKGVMHTPNTLAGALNGFIEYLGFTDADVFHMASPMAHQTGFLYGMLLPILLKTKAVLQDIWNPEIGARLIQDEGVTFTMASTPFLADLTDTPAVETHDVSSLNIFLTAGAPIPRVLVHRATERLAVNVVSAWGMTENGVVTATRPTDPPEKVFETDGKGLPGQEVRVVDEEGAPLPPGEEGRLQTRPVSNFVGYLNKPELYGTDPDGWFETGDIARMDADGYIRITGRAKDLIIRGGENIPVVEVEEVLYRHEAVQDAAIVGMPDDRLGERGCLFVTLRDGRELSLGEVVRFLEAERMARQYFPEHMEVLDEMPRTASGKIQKYRLRELARDVVG